MHKVETLCLRPVDAWLSSGASGSWAYFRQCWFNVSWVACPSWIDVPIAVKDCYISCTLWGQQMKSLHVCCRCDTAAVVAMINRYTSQHPHICWGACFHLCKVCCQLDCRASARMLKWSCWCIVKGQHTNFLSSGALCRGITLLHPSRVVGWLDTCTSPTKLAIYGMVRGFSDLPLLKFETMN